ncbi:hypothetical protein ACFQ3N_13070 [Virgibacillus byunsanensis]|uniref:Uncharacterized protein n=1 Tax=Virgibacillus byunsanensis TaxID=570945 RepID=A0ABW3LLU3_9BACI
MQKIVILLLTTLSIIVFVSGCTEKGSVDTSDKTDEDTATKQLIEDKDTQIKQLEEKNEELQNTLQQIETDFNYMKEEAEYYNQFIDDILNDYSDAQLKDLAKELWDYELVVNEAPVPRDGIIEVQKNTIEISMVQKQPAYVVLPNDIFMQGKINGNYDEHINFNTNPTETYGTDGTIVTGMHYKFVDVEKDATISFSITEELKKRLGLDTSEVTIKNR